MLRNYTQRSEATKITYLDETQTADKLRVTPGTLRRWRWLGIGPSWHKMVGAVRYLEADLHAFADRCRIDTETTK